ncbi:hypothetical protein ERJ75_000420600 [Trypanosoma vivax]|uniref:L-type lectin-like domain-containing protein n=1 Tax=Trypanosoma vivax (strain Y486) TaxID=1055687 RepID=G0TZE6_TRYVY|nr:hypothetical protein TRVL_00244 [Trypanosoma vivax]KAH8616816.1 hypothetical protein ERJ75_000441400 [Trypanosoma vivax]KAH8616931.1 hypothetical protein ERJ75_000420600 [Trypanosoma vivax]CCC49349.1 conserved hypothetical protein [Trypanosoma vivax Y486]
MASGSRQVLGASRLLVLSVLFFVCCLLTSACLGGAETQPLTANSSGSGVARSPVILEHSFSAPLVSDWWEEGVPHFMIGGSAVANEKFVRLTASNLGDHGFAFNVAPCDHVAWEVRLRFSIRPPLPIIRQWRKEHKEGEQVEVSPYQGGEGMALWYLEQPVGDDHQQSLKRDGKVRINETEEELLHRDPHFAADILFGDDDDGEDGDEDEDEESGTKTVDGEDQGEDERASKEEKRRTKLLELQKKREELYHRVFNRGTSVDDSNFEPRMLGLKFSDFKGFGILLDSVGHMESNVAERMDGNNVSDKRSGAMYHKKHEPQVTVVFNLPMQERNGTAPAVNNFDAKQRDFRLFPARLQCKYNFLQYSSHHAIGETNETSKGGGTHGQEDGQRALLENEPEDPVELVVSYHDRRLRVSFIREDPSRRHVVLVHNGSDTTNGRPVQPQMQIGKVHVETLCGEIENLDLPLDYHFGVSASTGAREERVHEREQKGGRSTPSTLTSFYREIEVQHQQHQHVDIHDVLSFELRELGSDAGELGYAKRTTVEHFDHEADKRERERFSRHIETEVSGAENGGDS